MMKVEHLEKPSSSYTLLPEPWFLQRRVKAPPSPPQHDGVHVSWLSACGCLWGVLHVSAAVRKHPFRRGQTAGNHHLQRIGSSLQCSFHPFRLPWWCISGTSDPCGRGLVLFNSGGFSVVFTILLCAHVDLWAPVKLNDDIDHLMLEEKVPLTVKNNRFDGIVSFSTQTPRLFVRHWTGLISERTTEFSASQQDANICNKQQFRTWLGKVTVENTTIWFFWMRICVGQKTATPTFSLGLLWATEVQRS